MLIGICTGTGHCVVLQKNMAGLWKAHNVLLACCWSWNVMVTFFSSLKVQIPCALCIVEVQFNDRCNRGIVKMEYFSNHCHLEDSSIYFRFHLIHIVTLVIVGKLIK